MKIALSPSFFSVVLLALALPYPASSKETDDSTSVSDQLSGKLIETRDKQLVDAELEGKPDYFVFYHSASWWGACRVYTKQLVSLNKANLELDLEDRRVQLILINHDGSERAGSDYLTKSELNFPSLRFGEKEKLGRLASLEGSDTGSLPHIVILKEDGTIIAEGSNPKIVFQVGKLIRGEVNSIESKD